jgi:predicted amidohydrolase YtcJ
MFKRHIVKLTAALIALSSTAVMAVPDKIYLNGHVITVDDQFSIANGFAIEGNKFSAVGNSEQLKSLADENTQIIDLQGRTVIPGLIDNHNHFIRGSYHWGSLLRLDGISTRAEALERLQKHAEQLEKDDWLLVLGGWNEEQFTDDPRGFSREELDKIAGNRPAFLQVQYSHAFVNTAFLTHIGVDVDKPKSKRASKANSKINKLFGPPLAELIERDKNGIATSRLSGGMGMVLQVSTVMPASKPEIALEGVSAAQQHFNSLGLTTVYDPAGALVNQQAVDAVELLHQNNDLSLRVFRTIPLSSLDSQKISRALQLRSLPAWLSNIILGLINNVESTSDAVDFVNNLPVESHGDNFYDSLAIGEVLYVPLHDSLDSHISEEDLTPHRLGEVRKLLSKILERGLAAQIHAVNSKTLDAYLTIIEDLSSQYTLSPNQITFTHAEGVNHEILERIRALNISLQIRSMPIVRSSQSLEKNVGSKALLMPPLKTIQDSGVTWGLGTDGTKASQINPMRTLHWAVTGHAINESQTLNQGQLLSREEALVAHTRSNAALLNREDVLGQIRPGYLADFVVLDADYLSVNIDQIPSIGIEKTVVSGKEVYSKASK